MGSCISSKKHKNQTKHAKVQKSRSPQPLTSPEETVKEVLSSETSTKTFQELKFSTSHKEKQQQVLKTKVTRSDVSSCLTGSTIVSTLCTTSHDVSDHMHIGKKSPVMFPPRNQSFNGKFGTKRDSIVGRTGGPSVKCRARSRSLRESVRADSGERCPSTVIARVGGGYAARPDLGRNHSCRRTSGYPCRVTSYGRNNEKLRDSLRSKELLENPVVSLECFIFL